MKKIINIFNKQNKLIKVGFFSFIISLFFLFLGTILIWTANFKGSIGLISKYSGNGFHAISIWGIDNFLSNKGYNQILTDVFSDKLLNYPIFQVFIGIVFMVILASIFFIISFFSFIFGYFKHWLYL